MKKPRISLRDGHPDGGVTADAEKLVLFVGLYCGGRHPEAVKELFRFAAPRIGLDVFSEVALCADCARLLAHALVKRAQCPLTPKPSCRKCPANCYLPSFRDEMEKVMRYSGPRSLLARWDRDDKEKE